MRLLIFKFFFWIISIETKKTYEIILDNLIFKFLPYIIVYILKYSKIKTAKSKAV